MVFEQVCMPANPLTRTAKSRRTQALGYLLVALLAAPTVYAAPASPKTRVSTTKTVLSKTQLRAIDMALKSRDPDIIRQGLKDIRDAGRDVNGLAKLVEPLLVQGVPTNLSIESLDTLGILADPGSSRIIAFYAKHRKEQVRRAAVRAIINTKGSTAESVLANALGDKDEAVRGIGAAGIGTIGARKRVPLLFTALKNGTMEAASSIGQLCNPAECMQLLKLVGTLPFDILASGIEPILFRDAAELSDDTKVAIIESVRDVGTAEAHAFLKDIHGRWPAKNAPNVEKALAQALNATAQSPGESPAKGKSTP